MTPGGNRPVFVISQIGYSYCLSAPLVHLIEPPRGDRAAFTAPVPAGSRATGAPETLASVQRRHHTFRARLVIIPFMHHSEPYMSTNNTYG